MKHHSFLNGINPIFITLTVMTIQHCKSAWKPDKIRVTHALHPGGGGQRKCDTRNINYTVKNASQDIIHSPNADFPASSPVFQAKKIGNICSVRHTMIRYAGTDPALGQLHNDQGSYDENFLDHVPEELIEQLDNCSSCLRSNDPATEAGV
jgi:hypothetical protein